MDNIITYIKTGLDGLTKVGIGLVSVSLLAEILFGRGALFGADVIGNVAHMVNKIGGENGLIGLIALLILIGLINKK